jgi:hypothetical protein
MTTEFNSIQSNLWWLVFGYYSSKERTYPYSHYLVFSQDTIETSIFVDKSAHYDLVLD